MDLIKGINVLRNNKSFMNITKNISWLTFEKVLQVIIGLLVGIWFARYLGPEQYGAFNYALSIITLFTIITTLGLNNIVIREIVKSPEEKHTYLGTSFIMMFIGGLFAYLLSLITITIIKPDSIMLKWLVAVMGVQLIFNSSAVIDIWFQSQVQSKKTVIAKTIAMLIISAAKVLLIIINAPMLSFAFLTAIGSLLCAIFLVIVYRVDGQFIRYWKVRKPVARRLIKDSWPLIFAGLSVSIYMKIDQIMVGNMLGEYALGNYSVAVKLTEVWYYMPIVIVASVYPSIIRYKDTSEVLYLKRLQQLYFIMTWAAIAIALPTTFIAPYLIQILYGLQYSDASGVLVIYVWSAVPVFLGVASGSYLMAENLTKLSFLRTVVGAIINVILNLLLIPLLGLTGAALTTIVSYTLATFFLILFRETNLQAVMMLKSFALWIIKSEYSSK